MARFTTKDEQKVSMQMKKLLGALVLFLVAAAQIPVEAWSAATAVNTRAAMVINVSTGKTLLEHNADTPIPPASITKVLTLYLVFEAIREGRAHLSDRVFISQKAAGTGGSRMHIQAGTEVSLEDLIKGMAVDSGNDACVAAAEHLAGSEAVFVAQMNRKVRELGMSGSHFINTHGLPAKGQVTTARDMARLSLTYLQRFPESLRVHSTQTFSYHGITQYNRNRLLGHCPGVDGIKTGWIAASGYNLLATARRGDTRVLVVVLGAPNPAARLVETRKLIEVAFQKAAMGSTAIELADLTSYVDPYGPPPGKRPAQGKTKKIVVAKHSPPRGTKSTAPSKGQTQLTKKHSSQSAKPHTTKQDPKSTHTAQAGKSNSAIAKQQHGHASASGNRQTTKLAKKTSNQSAKASTKSGAASGDPKQLKKKSAKPQHAVAQEHKTNGKSKEKTANTKKKTKPQAKSNSSHNT
jgi:D-alanyl-D-alanine carboxypeptidase